MPDAALDPRLTALANGQHPDPFSLLGPHTTATGSVVIRAMRPDAARIDLRIVTTGRVEPMRRLSAEGLFEVEIQLPEGPDIPDYRLQITRTAGSRSRWTTRIATAGC